ncbi:MAG: SO_0444 family Cu/Zn efflux transporter [Chitinivibrionales bacterium]|nr:SO_0444 family Cu/Zn efflux transporter [Chitinivibrionales bacterium]
MNNLLNEIVATFFSMAPYLLLGLTFAGILHVLFKKEFIVKHLGKNNLLSVFKASFLGVPLPLCSCGVIPTALSLRKSKASDGATMSFLISTPQTGVDSIFATYGMMGPVFAIFRPIAALIMGVAGGVTANLFSHSASESFGNETGTVSCTLCKRPDPHRHSIFQKIKGMALYAYGDFLDDISLQLVVGIIISGIIAWIIPPDFFTRYVGAGIISMLIMIVGGVPLYVCATASIPIAVALMEKGLSPGAAFVFLAVGPATNAASITLIGNAMGKKMVAVFLGSIAILSIAAGYLLNYIFALFQESGYHPLSHVHDIGVSPWKIGFSVIFLILLAMSLMRKLVPSLWSASLKKLGLKKEIASESPGMTFGIEGMTCNHCAAHVAEELRKVPGITEVDVDLHEKKARCVGTFNETLAEKAIADAGYSVSGERKEG